MKNIKLLGYVGLLSLGLSVTSCETETNNDELMSHINSLKDRVSALESLKTQVDALKALMDASSMNYMITSVEEIMDEGDNVIGYKISFSDREPIEIYNGESTAGMSVTIEADENGKLCWMLNGQFLEVDGEHVEAEGKTPEFRVGDDGILEVSYDGENYEDVPNATIGGETGSSVTVTEEGTYYEFTISGQTYKVLKYQELTVLFTGEGVDGNVAIVDENTASLDITYTIDGLYEGQSSVIMAFAGDGCSVSLDETQHKLTVTPDAEHNLVNKKITVFVSDGGQRTIMRTISFVDTVLDLSGTEVSGNTLIVPHEGGTMTVAVSSNYASSDITVSIPEGEKEWITIDETSTIKSRAIESYNLILTFTANEGISRTANLTIGKDNGKNVALTVKQIGILGDPVLLTVTYSTTEGGLEAFLTNTENTGDIDITTVTDLTITGGASLTQNDFSYLAKLSNESSLRYIDLSGISNTYFYAKLQNSNLEKIILPNNTQSIEAFAFLNCKKLKTMIIPVSVATVYQSAFANCSSMESIVFEGTILTFSSSGSKMFKGCSMLQSITLKSETPPTITINDETNGSLVGIHADCKLYVPNNLVENYKSSDWATALGTENIQAISEVAQY